MWIHGIIGAAMLIYLAVRAAGMAVTYDEAWTIMDFAPNSVWDVLRCMPCDANNQLLNTLLVKILYHHVGPDTLFTARAPNVIAGLVYMLAAHLIARRRPNAILAHGTFILLLANPFLLDLFSLARGYGLGLAFQLLSIHFALAHVEGQRMGTAALVTAVLAPLANLTFLLFTLSMFLLLPASTWFFQRHRIKRMIIETVIAGIILFALLFLPLQRLLEIDAFYYGGDSGIFQDTLMSLIHATLYDRGGAWLVAVFAALLPFLAFLPLLGKRRLDRAFLLVAGLLFLPIAGSILMHHLFGTLYTLDRGALYLYPPMILAICWGAGTYQDHAAVRWAMRSLLVLAVINTITALNTYKALLWEHEAYVPEILEKLDAKARAEGKTIRLDHSWPFRMTLRFYKERRLAEHVEIVKPPGGFYAHAPDADAYLLLDRSLTTAPYDRDLEGLDPNHWIMLWEYPDVNVKVMVRRYGEHLPE